MADTPLSPVESFLQRKAALKASQAEIKSEAPASDPVPDPDAIWAQFIPQVNDTPGDYSGTLPQVELDADAFFKKISIVDAYKMYGGKSPVSRIKKEMKVRCPNPAHPDNEASFAMNTQSNLFNCFKCGGGDVATMAAWHQGIDPRDKSAFRDIKNGILTDFGFQFPEPTQSTANVLPEQPGADPDPNPTGAGSQTQSSNPDSPDSAEPQDLLDQTIDIDWRAILPEDTFMREFMEETTKDDCPENYHFWSAMAAVSLAVGRARMLKDRKPVKGNMFLCYTGRTSAGKSTAKEHLTTVIREALPYKRNNPMPDGVMHLKGASSGEIIIKKFRHEMLDPNGKPIAQDPLPVVGLLDYEEFSEFTARTARTGNTLKSVLIDMHSAPATVGSHSLSNELEAFNPFATVVTTTQPKALRDLVSRGDIGSGFVNRWLFITGSLKPRTPLFGVEVNLTRPIALLKLLHHHHTNGTASSRQKIEWESDAAELFTNFCHSTIYPDQDANEHDETLSRTDLFMKKVIFLFACNEKMDVVNRDLVQRALSLYPYIVSTYRMADENINTSALSEDETRVIDIVRKNTVPVGGIGLKNGVNKGKLLKVGEGLTASQIFPNVKHRIKTLEDLNKILKTLIATGIIDEWPTKGRGQPSKFYTTAGTQVQPEPVK